MAHPLLKPVTSSSVEAYAYFTLGIEVSGSHSLFVEFKSKAIYRYIVPLALCQQMDNVSSYGKVVNEMKKMYVGELIGDYFAVTNMLNAIGVVRSPASTKAKARKKPSRAFFQQFPELEYFF